VDKTVNLNKPTPDKLLRLLFYLFETVRTLLQWRPDYCLYTISFNNPAFLKDYLLLLPCRWLGTRIIQYAHGNGLPDFYHASDRITRWLIDDLMLHSEAGIVLGYRLKYNFAKYFPDSHIYVVESGIKVNPNLSRTVRVPANGSVFTILYLGNLLDSKGFFDVIQSAPLVKRVVPCARYVIAGDWADGDERLRTSVLRYITERGLEQDVLFTGKVISDRKWECLQEADVLVFPTRYALETFGLVNLEAMQVGIPVITTARGGIPEIVEDGVNGLIVPEKDPAAIAEKVIHLYYHPEVRQRMGANNIAKFHKMYTAEAYGQRMIGVFEALEAARILPLSSH